jgi:hypothetical protein
MTYFLLFKIEEIRVALDFTEEEARFLFHHNIREDQVYDGRRQSKGYREAAAKAEGKDIILTSVRCRARGHRLRTRAGHCIQCKPANIGFIRRETADQYVYIAGSLAGQIIKIGTCGDINQRHRQMRAESYGGENDWVILHLIFTENAGVIERAAAKQVESKKVYREYWKDGISQVATEIFKCNYSEALVALSNASGGIPSLSVKRKKYPQYEFN